MSFLIPRNRDRPSSLRRRFFSLPTLISFTIATGFVAFLVTSFDLSWGKTWENIQTMDPWSYLIALCLYYLSFGFRGLRWRILARNAGLIDSPDARLPSFHRFSQLILIGWFVNSVVPLRLGDAYRAYGLSEDSKGGFSWCLGTVVAERALDMAIIFALVIIGAVALSTSMELGVLNYVIIIAFVMVFVLAVFLAVMKGYGTRLARLLPTRLEKAYHRFHKGTLGSLRQIPLLTALGLLAWLLEMCRLFFVVKALDVSAGLPLVMVAAVGHAILSTVPTPGGVGAVEPGVTGLLLLDLERYEAVSVALVDRSITYASVIVLGGLAFLLWQVFHARRHTGEFHRVEATSDRESTPDG